jgi:hypothetical protein
VNHWKQCSTDYGKDGHSFCSTVYTSTPFLTEEQKDRGNKCTSVTNTDPPNEIGNIPTPPDRSV